MLDVFFSTWWQTIIEVAYRESAPTWRGSG